MRVLIRAETVIPGMSGGVEHFTAGLLGGLGQVAETTDQVAVAIARGTQEVWEERVPSGPRLRYIPVVVAGTVTQAALRVSKSSRIHAIRDLAFRLPATRSALASYRTLVDRRLMSRVEPDVTYYPAHRHRISGRPSVITVHDLRDLREEFRRPGIDRALRANIARADAVVTSWPHPLDELRGGFPQIADHLFMIPFPVMNAPLSGVEPSADIGTGDPYLLYPAATGPDKNHELLIRALAMLRGASAIRLICTGAKVAPTYQRLVALVQELGLDGAVEFRGFVNARELDALYRRAALIVIPSLWEAASGPMFEAFAYGRPVACSDIPPIRRQVAMTAADVAMFDPHDPSQIADAVQRVLLDPARFEAGSRKGAAALAGLQWSTTAAAYLGVFRWIAGGRTGPKPVIPGLRPPDPEQSLGG